MSIVDLVFQYRTLLGKCQLGVGLEFDEIDEVTQLEAMFQPGTDDLHTRDGRRHQRKGLELRALLRGADINDRVAVHELSLGGLLISGAPYTNEGDTVEVVIDADQQSYRFKARVQWLDDDGDDYRVGLEFIGMPVRLTYGPASEAAEGADVLPIRIAA